MEKKCKCGAKIDHSASFCFKCMIEQPVDQCPCGKWLTPVEKCADCGSLPSWEIDAQGCLVNLRVRKSPNQK